MMSQRQLAFRHLRIPLNLVQTVIQKQSMLTCNIVLIQPTNLPLQLIRRNTSNVNCCQGSSRLTPPRTPVSKVHDNYPHVGSYVQVVFDTDPGVWFRCHVLKVDRENEGFTVKLHSQIYWIAVKPLESWRLCDKDVGLKCALTQHEVELVSKET